MEFIPIHQILICQAKPRHVCSVYLNLKEKNKQNTRTHTHTQQLHSTLWKAGAGARTGSSSFHTIVMAKASMQMKNRKIKCHEHGTQNTEYIK